MRALPDSTQAVRRQPSRRDFGVPRTSGFCVIPHLADGGTQGALHYVGPLEHEKAGSKGKANEGLVAKASAEIAEAAEKVGRAAKVAQSKVAQNKGKVAQNKGKVAQNKGKVAQNKGKVAEIANAETRARSGSCRSPRNNYGETPC